MTARLKTPSVSFSTLIWIGVISFAELVLLSFFHPLRINHDQALHLECGKLLIGGAVPYVDFLETNPPLIFYLDAIPAFFAQLFNVPPSLTFSVGVSLVGLASFLLSALIIQQRTDSQENLRSEGEAFLLGLVLINFFFMFDFGQREHLFVVLTAPYLVTRWLRFNGQSDAGLVPLLVGLLAAIGMALKPYFILPVLAAELYWLVGKRHPSGFGWLAAREVCAALVFFAAYAAHFLFLPKAARQCYFQLIVPMLKAGYGFYDVSTIGQLNVEPWSFFFVGGFLICAVVLLFKREASSPTYPIAAYTFASFSVYLIQNKGWPYHAMPFFAGSIWIAVIEMGRALRKINPIAARAFIAVPLCGLIGVIFVSESIQYVSENKVPLSVMGWQGTAPLSDLTNSNLGDLVLSHTNPGDPILFFSNAVPPEFPLTLQLNRRPASRYLHGIFLSLFDFIKHTDPKASLISLEPSVIDQYVIDLNKSRPKLVFIQIMPVKDYLDKYKFESKYLAAYQRLADVEGFRVYCLKGS